MDKDESKRRLGILCNSVGLSGDDERLFLWKMFETDSRSVEIVRAPVFAAAAYRQRKKDGENQLVGKAIDPRKNYSRVREGSLDHALSFLEDRLHLSWRKGLIKSIRYGKYVIMVSKKIMIL